jgi:transposase
VLCGILFVLYTGIPWEFLPQELGHGSGLGVYRWEIRDDIHEAFLSLACAIICWRRLRNLSPC